MRPRSGRVLAAEKSFDAQKPIHRSHVMRNRAAVRRGTGVVRNRGIGKSRASHSVSMVCENLESRLVFNSTFPSAAEIYMWELVNRARMDPQAEATKYGITISNQPMQPVSMNWQLTDSARGH